MKAAIKWCLGLTAVFVLAQGTALGAETQWYNRQQPVPEGQQVEIHSVGGKLAMTLKRPHFAAVKVKCLTTGVQVVWNVLGEGLDETRSISFTCAGVEGCSTPVVTSQGLPWPSHLYGEEHPLLDEWAGVMLTFTCQGAAGELGEGISFAGPLIPQQGDADEQCGGIGDDVDTELRFQPSGPRLVGPNGAELAVLGIYKLADAEHKITGEVFPCKSRGVGK